MGQSTLDLFLLFGLMLSEPDIHPITVSICISTYLNFLIFKLLLIFLIKIIYWYRGQFFARSHVSFIGGVTLLGPDLFWRVQLGTRNLAA